MKLTIHRFDFSFSQQHRWHLYRAKSSAEHQSEQAFKELKRHNQQAVIGINRVPLELFAFSLRSQTEFDSKSPELEQEPHREQHRLDRQPERGSDGLLPLLHTIWQYRR